MSALRSPIRSALFSAIRAVIQPLLTGGGGGLWDPRQWFTNGEEGVWYDLSDMSSLFQNAAGTIPVTAVGQPVGLILDKRLGAFFGDQLLVNGTFDTNVLGWTAVMSGAISWEAGAMRIENIAGNFGSAVQSVPETIVPGRTYRVTGVLRHAENHLGAPLNGRIALGGTQNAAIPIGPFAFLLTAIDATPTRVHHASSTAGAFSVWDSVSVEEVLGNFISQPTAARRPLWTLLATGKYGITGDGVDDRIERSASGMEWPKFSYLCVGSSAALGTMQGTLNFGPFLEFWHSVNWEGFGAFLRTAVGSAEHPRVDLEVYDTDAIFTTLSSNQFRQLPADQPVVLSTYCEDNLQTAQINGDSKWTGGAPYTPISPVGNSNLRFLANGVVWSLSDAVLINRQITDAEFQQYVNYAERVFGVVTPANP
jgi:hypothetical protein